MAFDVNTFKSKVKNDFARPNLFEVTMTIPGNGGAGSATERLTFTCRAAQIPGSTLGMVPVNYFGREIKLAGNRTFAEWTITIMNDEEFVVRAALEQWMSGINSHKENIQTLNGLNAYSVNADVKQYKKDGSTARQYTMIGAWCGDLAPIELDWGANDTIEEYTATLYYQYWQVTKEARNERT